MAGGRIATAVTRHLVDATVSTRARMAGHYVELAMAMQEAFFRLTGQELRTNAGPILRQVADGPDLDADTRRLLHFIAAGRGQLATMLGNQVVSTALGSGLGLLLTNTLQPVVGSIIATQPHMPISIADAVRAQMTGRHGHFDMGYEAAQQGIARDKFDMLVDLARPEPTPDMLFDWIHKGATDLGTVRMRLAQQGFRDWDVQRMAETMHADLAPERLADAVVFGAIGQEEARAKAAQSGMTNHDFDLLVNSAGMPPSKEELAFALRRGTITKDQFDRGLRQGPLRNEWIPLVESMVLVPMSTADAIDAAAKGHLPEDRAKAIALANGLQADQYQPLRDSAGSPPGVQQMLAWWKRGILTEAQVEQGLRESRLMNKYIPYVMQAAEKVPPQRTVVSLVAKGAISRERGRSILLQDGYSPDVADAMLAQATAEKTARQRDLSLSHIVALYEDRAITRPQALELLGNLGLDEQEAAWELLLGDLSRKQKFINAAISKVRSSYVARRIDENTASNALDSLSVAPDQRDDLLGLWDLERSVSNKELSLAQLGRMAKKGLIGVDELGARLIGQGWAPEDAQLIMEDMGVIQ